MNWDAPNPLWIYGRQQNLKIHLIFRRGGKREKKPAFKAYSSSYLMKYQKHHRNFPATKLGLKLPQYWKIRMIQNLREDQRIKVTAEEVKLGKTGWVNFVWRGVCWRLIASLVSICLGVRKMFMKTKTEHGHTKVTFNVTPCILNTHKFGASSA